MIELKDVYIHCAGGDEISNLSFCVDDGHSLLAYGGNTLMRQCLTEALLGVRPVASGYLSYDGELLDTDYARFLRSSIGLVPCGAPDPQISLRQTVDQLVRLGAFRRFRKEQDKLSDLWQAAGINASLAETPLGTLQAEDMQTGMLSIDRWLDKQIVIVDGVAGPKPAQMLREMVASGTLVIATAPDNSLAEYFDNNINIGKQ